MQAAWFDRLGILLFAPAPLLPSVVGLPCISTTSLIPRSSGWLRCDARGVCFVGHEAVIADFAPPLRNDLNFLFWLCSHRKSEEAAFAICSRTCRGSRDHRSSADPETGSGHGFFEWRRCQGMLRIGRGMPSSTCRRPEQGGRSRQVVTQVRPGWRRRSSCRRGG